MEEQKKRPDLNMAKKYGVSYAIVYEAKPKWRQREINVSIGMDTRPNTTFAREVIEFAEDPENLTTIENKMDEIESFAEAVRKMNSI